jgi:hydroxymethylpyrimidine pyrophosphatase-like HAD family hydrolase
VAPFIVALDVDGTLFDGRSVDPAAVAAIEAGAAGGHATVIVSGRPWRDLQQIIPDVLRFTSVAVCEHGALLVDVPAGTVHQLAPPVDPRVAEMIAAADGDEMVVYEATIGLPATARELAEAACARVGGCYVVGNKASIAIVPDGCDKGTGLTHAVEHLGMSDRRVIAVGDATNDLPMFAVADIAIAVANAEPALTAAGGIEVTEGAFGAGVAEALGRHLAAPTEAHRTRTTPSDSPPRTSYS